MANTEVAVTPAEVAAARAYIEISGGEDNINPAVVRLAHAKGSESPDQMSRADSSAAE